MEPGAEIEGIPQVAVGTRGDDRLGVHGAVLNDGGAETGRGPGAEGGGCGGGEDAD